ncbi:MULTISPECIES: sugar ABC transporter ATP-binding protein [Dictyoglomus]|jgi:rhamnose transport system ATP-binding protein|uniref:Autoinducer 2 import ATP-binding protein LsrA n=1 Tax=Dictyoglomus turgidum (strain DSM 6724 / Z-1310) TaxID=515635 RepID=B8E1T6_DICTD|nr:MULTISPECIES: sugar ABC transporter ATP-binding protein [Dictyoglomus]ACK41719.1 ABC transporter related [Dictyoglomus turgidum DSM 6724]PNV79630.1 MAG: sugar ABC transporter ATP-binding protein [Dictyoglomus turgidum]HBU31787.1 sugar ABC transporter ATP-binding protein [Dictyoglomus sp.]
MEDYILEVRNIYKSFTGAKPVLEGVNFNLKKGEIHALLGENGAGKSTLIKIISGVLQPDHGDILLKGKKVYFGNPMDAQKHGIAAVFQELALFPELSVAENIFIGHYKYRTLFRSIDWKDLYKEANSFLNSLGIEIDPKALVKDLSIAERQIVEIARVLSINPEILIMDEPTSSLTLEETQRLFNIVRSLKEKGTSIIFISHRLEEVFAIADRVTVLRDGQYIGTKNVAETSVDELIQMMVGRKLEDMYPKVETKKGELLLKVDGLTRNGEFYDVSFELFEGEVLGIAGLVGSGRTEVAQTIFGIRSKDKGKIYIRGEEVNIKNPKDAISLGIVYVPEDRHQHGLLLPMDIVCNTTLPILESLANRGIIDRKEEEILTKKYFELLDIRASGIRQKVMSLSGGNQQKVVLAKWLATKPKILILDEPTRGIDVGAKVAIYQLINKLAQEGYGIILISSEMPEIIGMSDRIIIMHEGRIVGTISRREATQEKILSMALGRKVYTKS